MTTFDEPKFFREVGKILKLLDQAIAYCGEASINAGLLVDTRSDIHRVASKALRGFDAEASSGRIQRANAFRSLLGVISIYTKDARFFMGTIGRLRRAHEIAIELANWVLIDDPTVANVEGMQPEWKETRRGSYYRRHELGFELLLEPTPDGSFVGSVGEVGVLSGLSAEAMREDLEAFVDTLFQPAIEHHRALALMMTI